MELRTVQDSKNDSEQTDIPIGILSFMQKKNGIYPKKLESQYSVTTLLNCIRKIYYNKNKIGSNQSEEDTFERLWSTTRGDFLHQITRAYNWRELDMNYEVILEDGKIATVSGRLDMYDWKTKTVIDLKTTKFVNWQSKKNLLPKYEHIMQVQIYGTMFSTVIPIENLCLVYADMDTMIAFRVKSVDMTAWITNRVQELDDILSKGQLPKGEVSKLCQFCKYQTQCLRDGNGIVTLTGETQKQNVNKVGGIYQ